MATDKKLHMIAGFLISLIGGYFLTPLIGLGLAALAGLLKEARDKISGKGTVEWLDFIATVVGGLPPLAIYYLLGR